MQTKPLTGNKAKELRENLQHIASKHQGHYVLGTVDTRAALTQSMDYTVYIYMALLSLTLLISMLGVANTIALSGYERAHENALLRVLGLSRTQLRSVVIMEAVLITFATVDHWACWRYHHRFRRRPGNGSGAVRAGVHHTVGGVRFHASRLSRGGYPLLVYPGGARFAAFPGGGAADRLNNVLGGCTHDGLFITL